MVRSARSMIEPAGTSRGGGCRGRRERRATSDQEDQVGAAQGMAQARRGGASPAARGPAHQPAAVPRLSVEGDTGRRPGLPAGCTCREGAEVVDRVGLPVAAPALRARSTYSPRSIRRRSRLHPTSPDQRPRLRRHVGPQVKRLWERLAARAELPARMRLYDATRHAFNSTAAYFGVPREIRMRLMGHSLGRDVHDIYTHLCVFRRW